MKTESNLNSDRGESLLRVTGLCQQFVQRRAWSRAKFTVEAFQDVDLTLHAGKTLALVGESGAGKSSLARCVALLEPPIAGKIELEGSDLLGLGREKLFPLRRQIQMIFQDATAALNPALTAGEIIAEPLVIQGVGTKAQRRKRALHLMEQVGLDPKGEKKRPFEFSGGQRQRLAIARGLALEPRVLILDEVLSNLDAMNQSMILRLLADLQRAHGLAYLHVSHELRLVAEFADEVAVMCEGRIVEQQGVQELFESPKHSYTRALLATVQSVDSILLERSA